MPIWKSSHDAPVLDWPGAEQVLARREALGALMRGGAGAAGLAMLGACATGPAAAAKVAPDQAPSGEAPERWVRPQEGLVAAGVLPFVRVYNNAEGRTLVERRDIQLSAEPIPGLLMETAETFAIRVLPPGMFFDWHKPSRRRMIAVLRGEAVMTLRDGSTAKAVPGMVLLVENTFGEGHRGQFSKEDFTITVDVGLAARPAP